MNCQSPSGIRMERGTRDGGFGGGQDCSFPCLSRWPSGWITRGALMVHGLLRHEISASHTSSLKGSTQGGRSGTGEGRERRGGGEKSFSSPIWVNKYFIQPGRQKKKHDEDNEEEDDNSDDEEEEQEEEETTKRAPRQTCPICLCGKSVSGEVCPKGTGGQMAPVPSMHWVTQSGKGLNSRNTVEP